MRYLAAIAISFVIGIAYGLYHQRQTAINPDTVYSEDFQPVEHVYDTPNDDRKVVQEEFVKPDDSQLFKPGDEITCIYNGVFSWSDGNQFMKTIPINCTVIEASKPEDNRSYGQSAIYQQIHVDCTKDVIKNTGSPGIGLVPNHPLNFKKRWMTTEECYHFVTQ